MKSNRELRINLTRLILDILAFIGFLLALDPRATGIPIHEWLTIAGTAAIVLHLLLDWNWIAGLTRRFFRRVALKARLNYILNWLFFMDGVVVMLSGILISEVVLPALGLPALRSHTWSEVHTVSADLSVFLLALHTALNWDWIVSAFRRWVFKPGRKTGPAQNDREEAQA